jgi:hypothetical protein
VKNTKNWSNEWIPKLKEDMRIEGARIGVLITYTMPPKIGSVGVLDGVWVCRFDEFEGVAKLLRDKIVEIDRVTENQKDRGDKMAQLYDYLTNGEFPKVVERIVEAFQTMKDDLKKEKAVITKQWAKREKQLDLIIENTTDMYGSLEAIAGGEIRSVNSPTLLDMN